MRTHIAPLFAATLLAGALHAAEPAAPVVLDLAATPVVEKNAAHVAKDGALEVVFAPDADWPNIVLDGRWDLSGHDELVATVRNAGTVPVRLEWRVNGPGGNWKQNSATEKTPIAPGERKTVVMKLLSRNAPGTPDGAGMDLARAERMEFILPRAAVGRTLVIESVVARRSAAAGTEDGGPPAAGPGGLDWAGMELAAKNAAFKREGGALEIAFAPEADWPNVVANGRWDFSAFETLALTVKNAGDTPVRLEWRVNNPGGNWQKDSLTERIPLAPGEEKTAVMKLVRRAPPGAVALHGMKETPPGLPAPGGIDPANVLKMEFILPRAANPRTLILKPVEPRGVYTPPATVAPAACLPLVDRFGQYRGADWPGKVTDVEMLRAGAAREAEARAASPAPAAWNAYGGWRDGPALAATGAFRTEKHKGMWTLVDPEGRLFFSMGVNHVNIGGPHSATAVFRRDGWFEELPTPNDPANRAFWFVRLVQTGDYSGNYVPGFSFIAWNLARKHGPDWRRRGAEVAPERLRHWGLNTLGNWSDPEVAARRQMPYTVGVALAGRGARVMGGGPWRVGSMWDVYDPGFAGHVDRAAASMAGAAASPWCLGVFFDNELHWAGDFPRAAFMASPAEPGKRAFMAMLREKYVDVAAFNRAIGADYAAWDDVADRPRPPDPTRAAADFDAFYARTADVYHRTVRDAIRAHCPGRLYLGARYAASQHTPRSIAAAAKYCDVVSFNIYADSVDGFALPDGVDAPVMATEYHFGAADRGLFGVGLVAAADQADRAARYRRYAESALRHPNFVGCHWFQYYDQPLTGRIFDGENYNIGFLDVCDRPYPELTSAARSVAEDMYRLRFPEEDAP